MFTDLELYHAIRHEGPDREVALRQLRDLLIRGVRKSLTGRYGKPISVEDVVQDALIQILHSIEQYQGKSKFTTWSMTIAIRLGISDLRRKFHADQSLDAFSSEDRGEMELTTDESPTPEKNQLRKELIQRLQKLIESYLTDKQRVVVRAYLCDFSTDGIADNLGMNRNAVYKLLHDARVKLREGLMNSGYDANEVLSILAAAGYQS